MNSVHGRGKPGAFLALYNGISSAALQPEYETWHGFEHVPERVGLPGFIEARRYRSVDHASGRPPAYFTCYWLESCDALASQQYREVAAQPTPWSARMRVELRDFLRLPCRLQGAAGNSTARQLAVLCLRPVSGALDGVCAGLLERILQSQVRDAAAVCAHWGVVQSPGDFPVANRGTDVMQGDGVVMLQHLDVPTLRQTVQALVQHLAPAATVLVPPSFYELLSIARQDDLRDPLSSRQPARPELFQRFISGDIA